MTNLVELEGFETPDLLFTMGFRSASWPGITVKARSQALLQPGWDGLRAVRAGCDLPDSSQPVTEEEPMSYPGFTPPDLCSIRSAAEQEELAEPVRTGSAPPATHWAMTTRSRP